MEEEEDLHQDHLHQDHLHLLLDHPHLLLDLDQVAQVVEVFQDLVFQLDLVHFLDQDPFHLVELDQVHHQFHHQDHSEQHLNKAVSSVDQATKHQPMLKILMLNHLKKEENHTLIADQVSDISKDLLTGNSHIDPVIIIPDIIISQWYITDILIATTDIDITLTIIEDIEINIKIKPTKLLIHPL